MIHVRPQPEPSEFDAAVRQPGENWLFHWVTTCMNEGLEAEPDPALPPYWRLCLPQLREAYKGICAYYGCYVEEVTGAGSTDHFVAKGGAPDRAYEWSNLRFACSRMNARKRDAADVLDPFDVADGWFQLSFPLMTVHPAPTLGGELRERVLATRDRLGLNDDACCRERRRKWEFYSRGAAVQDLWESAPFIALEAVRQGLLRDDDVAVTAAQIRAWLDA